MDKNFFRDLTYGMFVVGTNFEGRDVGCFVNTVTQITSESMIIALSLNKKNFTNSAIKKTKRFSVSVLSTRSNPEVIGRFGFYCSKDIDKFAGFNFIRQGDVPVLEEDICGYMICELLKVVSVDTHDVFLAKVIDCKKTGDFEPMTYAYYHSHIKGKAPKTAPTFIEDQPSETKNMGSGKYRCIICGHIYDEEVEKVKFKDLPDDWKCPICGVGKENFMPI